MVSGVATSAYHQAAIMCKATEHQCLLLKLHIVSLYMVSLKTKPSPLVFLVEFIKCEMGKEPLTRTSKTRIGQEFMTADASEVNNTDCGFYF